MLSPKLDIKKLIVAETENFVALNKPAGLLTIPDRAGKDTALSQLLKQYYGQIFTVHRIDRHTSGLVLFAKTDTYHQYLSSLFENREMKKRYLGLVMGAPAEPKATINVPIAAHEHVKGLMIVHKRGKESITDYEVLAAFGRYAWLQFQIHTGRTHQIRVHCKNMGCPIACDPVYGDGLSVLISSINPKYKLSKNQDEEQPILNRLALHSYQLSFTDTDGSNITLEAPLPKDLKALLQQLNKWGKAGRHK